MRLPPHDRTGRPVPHRALGNPKRSTRPTDTMIGGNIRALRLRRQMSQGALGKLIGVTFQQVQKYENGSNRVGAGRLAEIAFVFGVPVAALFEGVDDVLSGDAQAPAPILDAQALRAAESLAAIHDRPLRRALLALIERAAWLARAGGVR